MRSREEGELPEPDVVTTVCNCRPRPTFTRSYIFCLHCQTYSSWFKLRFLSLLRVSSLNLTLYKPLRVLAYSSKNFIESFE